MPQGLWPLKSEQSKGYAKEISQVVGKSTWHGSSTRHGHAVVAATVAVESAGLFGSLDLDGFRSDACLFVSFFSYTSSQRKGPTAAFLFPRTESGVAVLIGVFAPSFFTSA